MLDPKKYNAVDNLIDNNSSQQNINSKSEDSKKHRFFDIQKKPDRDHDMDDDEELNQSKFDMNNKDDEMYDLDHDNDKNFGEPIGMPQVTASSRDSEQSGKIDRSAQNEDQNNSSASPVDKANAEPDKQQKTATPIEQANATPPEVKNEFEKKKDKSNTESQKNNPKSNLDSEKGAKKIGTMAKDALAAVRGNIVAAIKLGAALFKDKKTRWIIIGALAISGILTVMAILIPLSFLGGIGKDVSLLGKTLPQTVSPTEDKDLVSNSLKLLGNPTITQAQTNDLVDKNAKEIIKAREAALERDPSGNDPIAVKGQVALDSGNALKAKRTQENAKTYIKNIGIFLSANQNLIPKFNGTTQKPTKSTELTFNNDLHGGSFQRKEHVDNHGVYSAYDKGTCDAVDISTSENESIFPIFAGRISSVKTNEGGEQFVKITNGDYTALYAHLKNFVKAEGSEISLDGQMGTAFGNNIQIEIIYKNRCLVTTSSDVLDYKTKDRKHAAMGGYLWDHILEIFNLNNN